MIAIFAILLAPLVIILLVFRFARSGGSGVVGYRARDASDNFSSLNGYDGVDQNDLAMAELSAAVLIDQGAQDTYQTQDGSNWSAGQAPDPGASGGFDTGSPSNSGFDSGGGSGFGGSSDFGGSSNFGGSSDFGGSSNVGGSSDSGGC